MDTNDSGFRLTQRRKGAKKDADSEDEDEDEDEIEDDSACPNLVVKVPPPAP